MSNNIQPLTDYQGEQFFPITHERAVRDDDGNTLESKIQQVQEDTEETLDQAVQYVAQNKTEAEKKIARANLGLGNGDIDDEPTAGSDNLVKSGGVVKKCPSLSSSDYFSITDDDGFEILSIEDDFFKVKRDFILRLNRTNNGAFLKNNNGIWEASNLSIGDVFNSIEGLSDGDILMYSDGEWVTINSREFILSKEDDNNNSFRITDDDGKDAICVSGEFFRAGKFEVNFVDNRIICDKLLTDKDWLNKVLATYGDSVTAINNGDFEFPYIIDDRTCWGNYIANYFLFRKQFGRGIGAQMFTWSHLDGGSVSFVTPSGVLIGRLDSYSYDQWNALEVKVYPSGVTAEMVASGEAIPIRSASCSWVRIIKMFPETIKDTIDVITVMYHNDAAASDSILNGELEWVSGSTTDPEWLDSSYYNTYGGDYNIKTTRGGIASTIMKLQAWMPKAVIVLCTPISGRGTNGQLKPTLKDDKMQRLAEIVFEMSRLMSIPCIDVYGTDGINGLNRTEYIADGIHPYTVKGKKAVARTLISGLKNIIPNF